MKINLKEYHMIKVGPGIVKTMTIPLVVTIKDAGEYNAELPGEEYDPTKEYNSEFVLQEKVEEWTNANINGKIFGGFGCLYFESEEEAVAFKLRWS